MRFQLYNLTYLFTFKQQHLSIVSKMIRVYMSKIKRIKIILFLFNDQNERI